MARPPCGNTPTPLTVVATLEGGSSAGSPFTININTTLVKS